MQMATKLLSFTTKQQKRQQQQWPLKDENNKELILPSDLYWNYVYPYTTVDNRIIINKHTKSTQHYAGRRAEINPVFLYKYGCKITHSRLIHRVRRRVTSSASNINGIEVLDSMISDWVGMNPNLFYPPLDLLRQTRWCWDKYISKIESPSERLHTCLHFIHYEFSVNPSDNTDCYVKELPLLFCGQGIVDDVVKFHSLMDANSINGPIKNVDSSFITIFPKTLVGVWLDRYLRQAKFGMAGEYGSRFSGTTLQLERIVRALLDAEEVDVVPFFEPLETNNLDESILSFYANSVFQPGISIVDCMRGYSNLFTEDMVWPRGLDWVFEKLEAVHYKKKHLSRVALVKKSEETSKKNLVWVVVFAILSVVVGVWLKANASSDYTQM